MTDPRAFASEVIKACVADRTSETLHPSGLRACDRRMLLGAAGVEQTNPMDVETKWRLARYGTYEGLLKRGLLAYAGEHAMTLDEQYELNWLDFHGYVDFALRDQYKTIFIEVKSSKPSAFGKGYMPYESHKAQAQAYYVMDSTSDEMNPDLTTLLFYISRWYDGKKPDFAIYDVTPTEEEYDELKEYMCILQTHKSNGYIPEIPFAHSAEHPFLCSRYDHKRKERVKSCQYFDYCWKNELPV